MRTPHLLAGLVLGAEAHGDVRLNRQVGPGRRVGVGARLERKVRDRRLRVVGQEEGAAKDE